MAPPGSTSIPAMLLERTNQGSHLPQSLRRPQWSRRWQPSRLWQPPRRRSGAVGRAGQGGQATVELALVLPVVMIVVVLVVQIGLLARDRVLTVHAARTAARSVAVDPSGAAARAALDRLDGPGRFTMTIGGDASPGGMATVTVTGRPTTVPILGALLGSVELREQLSVRVEGP